MKLNKKIHVASSSKWLAAAVIMSLVDEGSLSLSDPVSKYIPNFKGDKAGITLEQLMSHTSGLSTSQNYYASVPKTLKMEAEIIGDKVELDTKPGTEFYYGGVTFQVVGRIAEVVTGKAWEDIFYERIGDLCRMRNTDFGYSENPGIAAGALSSANDFANFLTMIFNDGKYKKKGFWYHE